MDGWMTDSETLSVFCQCHLEYSFFWHRLVRRTLIGQKRGFVARILVWTSHLVRQVNTTRGLWGENLLFTSSCFCLTPSRGRTGLCRVFSPRSSNRVALHCSIVCHQPSVSRTSHPRWHLFTFLSRKTNLLAEEQQQWEAGEGGGRGGR